jgi:hypothetical protein
MSTIKGSEIIDALLDNLNQGAEEIYQVIAVPEVYWIYLHPADFREVRHKSDRIVEESRKALSDEIKRLNGALAAYEKGPVGKGVAKGIGLWDQLSGIARGKPGKRRKTNPKYAEPDKGWQISINADVEGICKQGDVIVKSIISYGKGIELQGNKTIRLVTIRVDGKKNTTREVVDRSATGLGTSLMDTVPSEFAHIFLLDGNGGRTTYKMRKSTFVVGRGGTAYWVDLPILDDPRVSQEHLRIIRDEQTGEFFIKDLSRNGTELDGVRLPSSIENVDGQTRETDLKTKLPDNSRIVLAGGGVALEFGIVR